LKFAATYVDCCPDFEHVDTAISYVKRVLETYTKDSDEIIAFAHARRASLLQKKWELTEENAYLAEAIEAYGHALRHMQDERNRGRFRFPGMIAHTRLKLLTLRRKIGRDSKRQDLEGHRDAILKIVERSDDDPVSISYLHWSQAIALADLGETDQANGVVAKQLVQDAKLASQCIEVGGRQYLTLRQFLERYQDTWTNMGVISRQLRVSLR
jgi:tetratricopeptide (TPR) repeat protein